MENASKALLMAGGILIAILIIGAVTFMFRDVTEAQRTQEESRAIEQINEYNKQFSGYERTLYGHELLSLINKIINTNLKNTEQNKYNNTSGGDGYPLIDIEVVSTSGYKISKCHPTKSEDLPIIYEKFRKLKDKITRSQTGANPGYGMAEDDFKQIVELQRKIKNHDSDADKAKLKLKDILDDYSMSIDQIAVEDINTYEKYIDFKETKFSYETTGFDEDSGRIDYMKFKQK